MRKKFHTFDALRFFSFLVVFMSHLPYNSHFRSFESLKLRGDIGVYFFFVLSGFLISYIILLEKKETGTFNLKNYFIRRVLRIWPLYYLILLFAYLTPHLIHFIGLNSTNIGYQPNWLLSSLFLENYMIIYHNEFANVSPLPVMWSLCIEEHFYIIWGVILFYNRMKNIPFLIIVIMTFSNIARVLFYHNHLLFKDILTNFDFFMCGAIPAYLYVNYKEKTITYIEKVPTLFKSLLLATTVTYVLLAHNFNYFLKPLFEPVLLGLFFTMTIIIFLPKNNKIKIADSNLFSKLGIYTYGLYVFHSIFINLANVLYKKMNLNLSETICFLVIFSFSIITTIITSYIVYWTYEKPFLNLKPTRTLNS
jgi:peptidoglycan/LPS O-acetylase OafA/YrhL